MISPSQVFARRLREARKRMDWSQEQLGAEAGIDEFSASSRISQYETGKHVPRYEIALNLARPLKVPVEFLYAADDQTAELLLHWGALNDRDRGALLKLAIELGSDAI